MEELKVEMRILKQIEQDVSFLKRKITSIEEELNSLNSDFTEVDSDYAIKLRKIAQGSFISKEEFEKMLAD